MPIEFFSKKLSQTQSRYSTFDRELLTAFLSVLDFYHLIESRQVLLLTDHRPICDAFHSLTPVKLDRQLRQLDILTEFISDIAYAKVSQNIVDDCLSRLRLAVQVDACDLPIPAEAQISESEIRTFTDLGKFSLPGNNRFLLCGT